MLVRRATLFYPVYPRDHFLNGATLKLLILHVYIMVRLVSSELNLSLNLMLTMSHFVDQPS